MRYKHPAQNYGNSNSSSIDSAFFANWGQKTTDWGQKTTDCQPILAAYWRIDCDWVKNQLFNEKLRFF